MKILLRLACCILFQLTSLTLSAQQYANNWHINDCELKFLNDTVVVTPGYPINRFRSVGIMSDRKGNLLFYSDGLSAWNKNHEFMPNGEDLNIADGRSSVAIPKPGSESIYYVFTVDGKASNLDTSGVYYSVIDMNLDNGLGDVTEKGIKLIDDVCAIISATFHSNNKDIWIIAQQYDSDKYFSILLTENGISETITESSIGKVSGTGFAHTQLKCSPDGKKIAGGYNSFDHHGFDIFDFDASSGILSNPLSFNLPTEIRDCDGIEFSSDVSKLYAIMTGSIGEARLLQYDLSDYNEDAINQSMTPVLIPQKTGIGQLQLAPNGKIYFLKGGGDMSGTEYLGVVNYPNETDLNCDAVEQGLYLQGSNCIAAGTPNFIQNYFFRTNFTVEGSCQSAPVSFKITNEYKLDSTRWYFGEGSTTTTLQPVFTYNEPRTYTVQLLAYYPEKCDTISKQITINPFTPFDLGEDTSVCMGDKITVPGNFETYLWNNGDITFYTLVNADGQYKATASNNFGCMSSDSVYLEVNDLPVIDLPDTLVLGDLDSLKLEAGDFSSYKWSTGDTLPFITVSENGWYSVQVKNESGCVASKSVLVLKQINTEPENDMDWKTINPLPSYLTGRGIYFLNEKQGFIVNEKGLLKTTDGGENWQKVMALTSANRIKFKNSIGYIIGNFGTIYKSTHEGSGWNKLTTPFTDYLNSISLITEDTLRITGRYNLFLSDDGGRTWETRAITGVAVNDACFISTNVGHAACDDGTILKTVDGGLNWYSTFSTNTSPSDFFRIEFVNDTLGFASREFDYVYKTTNGGETWQNIKSLDAVYDMQFLDTETGFLSGEYGTMYKTSDGGKNWQYISPTGRIDAYDIYGIFFINENEGFATGARGRILKTVNGGSSWQEYAPTYIDITQFNFITDSIANFLVGNTIFKTSDEGKTITKMGAPLSGQKTGHFDFVNEDVGYVIAGGSTGTSASSDKVYKTTNGGISWEPSGNNFGYFNESFYSIDFINEDLGFVSGGYNQPSVFRTKNGGDTWEKVENISFKQMQFFDSLNGYGFNYRRIYKTTDGGDSWSVAFDTDEYITSVYFIDESTGYLTGDSGLMYRTDDGGKNWKKLNAPYEYFEFVRFATKNIGFLVEDYGKLYKTSDGGENWELWTQINGLRAIEIRSDNIYIYGTYGKILANSINVDSVSIHINPADSVTNTQARISATVASNGGTIDSLVFTYSGSGTPLTQIAMEAAIGNDSTADVSVLLTNLKSNSTFYYSLYVVQGGRKYYSDTNTFTTLNDYEIRMNYVFEYSSDQANVSGQIISRDTTITDIEFQYGNENSFDNIVVAIPNTVQANETAAVQAQLTSLAPNTRYFVRLKASYRGKEIFSSSNTAFTTTPEYLLNMYSPYVNEKSLTIQGYIRAYKDTITDFIIQFGKSRNYDLKATVVPDIINKGEQRFFECHLNDLDSNTVYFYQPRFVMGTDTVYGEENIISLNRELDIVILGAEEVSDSSVIVKAIVNSYGKYVRDLKFVYGINGVYTDSVYSVPNYVANFNSQTAKATVTGLIPNSEYSVKFSAIYNSSRIYSESISFFFTGLTDVTNQSKGSEVDVYPNPTEQFIRIKCSESVSHTELINLQGIVLLKSRKSELDLSAFPSGIYFVKVYYNNKFITRKIIKK